jgi:hypothetical protein
LTTSKYITVAERLSRRIRNGDYHLNPMPAERELAVEVGVSHMTARKAVQKLVKDGLLARAPNGRLEIRHPESRGVSHAQIALLVPAFPSDEVTGWYISMVQLQARFRCSFRTVYYSHWDDPAIFNCLERFDGVFLLPVPEPMPEFFLSELLKVRRPVVVLDSDWSHWGIPSCRLYPPVLVQKLLDHLAGLGHRQIDCLNTQPNDAVVAERIAQWRIWLTSRGLAGELLNAPVPPYSQTLPAAYQIISRRLQSGSWRRGALLCTTEPAAVGAIRALLDHQIRPGHDVAVCTIDGEVRAEYAQPTLTALESPDPRPYLALCVEWMLAGPRRTWNHPLLLQPGDVTLAVRQSTVADIDRTQEPQRRRGPVAFDRLPPAPPDVAGQRPALATE